MIATRIMLFLCAGILVLSFTATASAQTESRKGGHSITDAGFEWPDAEQVSRVLLMKDHNTRVVVLGVMFLGLASGTIGTFLLLRKRSLTADALSHAALPGIAMSFILMHLLGGDGKNLPGLLIGAAVFGAIGVGCILLIRSTTRLKDDAALGIVLSVFFGLGMVLLSIIQDMPGGDAAGLNRFIFGKAASMLQSDALLILIIAIIVVITCALIFKEFKLLCFDQGYARSQGWPTLKLDIALMSLVVTVTVIALQSVGVVMAVALLIIPPAAARFWTDRLRNMAIGAAAIGTASGYLGATISALMPKMPTGPVIVLVCTTCFIISMICGTRRGIIVRSLEHFSLTRRVGMQHLLRAMFELTERTQLERIAFDQLLDKRSWTPAQLRQLLRRARAQRLVFENADDTISLTEFGITEARRVTRNHRLWETYLITHADIAPSHVDRDADMIEHVLGAELIERLEAVLDKKIPAKAVPPSPHPLGELA